MFLPKVDAPGEISSRIQLNDSIANLLSGKLATSAIAAASIFLYVIVMLQYDKA
ncbi:hypothetical protein [Nostoc edaphicum]|uniref:hypothetical protein n=1 Tax=Nostoc edaphicum TaxID=264686 RepID=UPI002AD44F02|nr:hypothetical protein [Nostoc edaphicum]